ncbi:MAG: flagellar biosynthetic protein FliO [Desulfovibrio sp.]|jgi:flagellar biosynthetic protein FliO|nr:flagellar biosynthetic protein FliO [Desulfovibrio sp.]
MNATLPPAGADAPAASLPDSAVFSWGGYFEALAWLCFALALFCLILWVIKRRGGVPFSGASSGARIESRLALGPKKWLLAVHFQGRRLLLGLTDQNITLLCELPPEEAAPSRTKDSPTFAEAMDKEADNPGGRT